MVGYRLWGHTESDTTKVTLQQQQQPPGCLLVVVIHGHLTADPLEKGMATHSSVLAWRIPGMGEPGGLPSMGSHRVGHD